VSKSLPAVVTGEGGLAIPVLDKSGEYVGLELRRREAR
jgi:hypothetical protein